MKTNRMLGIIKRNFADRSKETMMSLYKTLARPHLEYCSQIWNTDIKLIEGVQRRATKLVTGMQGLHYDERLKQLGLMWLERRRVRSDLIEMFKIMNGVYDTVNYFSSWMKAVEEVMTRNCLRKDSDLILGKMLLLTESLITGTHYLQITFIVKLFSFFYLSLIK